MASKWGACYYCKKCKRDVRRYGLRSFGVAGRVRSIQTCGACTLEHWPRQRPTDPLPVELAGLDKDGEWNDAANREQWQQEKRAADGVQRKIEKAARLAGILPGSQERFTGLTPTGRLITELWETLNHAIAPAQKPPIVWTFTEEQLRELRLVFLKAYPELKD